MQPLDTCGGASGIIKELSTIFNPVISKFGLLFNFKNTSSNDVLPTV